MAKMPLDAGPRRQRAPPERPLPIFTVGLAVPVLRRDPLVVLVLAEPLLVTDDPGPGVDEPVSRPSSRRAVLSGVAVAVSVESTADAAVPSILRTATLGERGAVSGGRFTGATPVA